MPPLPLFTELPRRGLLGKWASGIGVLGNSEALQRLAVRLDRATRGSMNAGLEDPRRKMVEVVERGLPRSEAVWVNLFASCYSILFWRCFSYVMILFNLKLTSIRKS
jgi:hypothetical protein